MEPDTAHDRRAEYTFLDVREDYEWESGHIEDAIHIPLQQLPERYLELEKRRNFVVVCQIGQRSDLAAQFLKSRGFEAFNLDGGLERWTAEGYPLVMSNGLTGSVVDGYAQDLVWDEPEV